jgi:uncharacterized SAM-binding protein YcdF (DUF218 family)
LLVIIHFLKEHAHLDSPIVVVGVLVIVLGVLWRRAGVSGPRRLLMGFVAAYWFLATPIGAGLLVFSIAHGLTPLPSREAARGADTVVVLGGGAETYREAGAIAGVLTPGSVLRALEGARVYKLIDARLVIASGGLPRADQLRPESLMLRDTLVEAGVPAERIVEESSSKTTLDQVRILGPLFVAHRVSRFVLVTSPTHMRRALATFRAAGFDAVPSVSPLTSDNVIPPPWLLPNDFSLNTSDQAVYDYAAGFYYWLNGWTKPAAWR